MGDVGSVVGIAVCVAVLRPRRAAVRSRENSDSDECTNEGKVKEHPQPAQPSGSRVGRLLDQRQNGGDECIQNSGSEDAFDGTKGVVDTVASLDGVYQTVDLVETLREEAERDDGGDELQDAG